MEEVVLVDEYDNPIGTMEKMQAHQKALLHRAFSVFILNSRGELLLQQRAFSKYHSAGLWTNACCSHQRPGESTLKAANRRLQEEMGMKAPLRELFWFIYKAPFDNGLTEHELDHVLVGTTDAVPNINSEEVAAYKWLSINAVKKELELYPEHYTVWFKIIFNEFYHHFE